MSTKTADEIYGQGHAQYGGATSVKARQIFPVEWDAASKLPIGALEVEAGVNLGGVEYSVAEVYSGFREDGYAITVHGSKMTVEVVPLEFWALVRMMEDNVQPENIRLNVSDQWGYSFGYRNKPRMEWELTIEFEPWNNPHRPFSGSKPRILTLHQAHIVGPVPRQIAEGKYMQPNLKFEGIASTEDSGALGDWKHKLITAAIAIIQDEDPGSAIKFKASEIEAYAADYFRGWVVEYTGADPVILADPSRLIVSNTTGAGAYLTPTHAWPASVLKSATGKLYKPE